MQHSKTPRQRRRGVVRIVWEDVLLDGSWFTDEDVKKLADKHILIEQIGWVVYEDRKVVILACQKASDGDCGGCTRIPKSLIRSRK